MKEKTWTSPQTNLGSSDNVSLVDSTGEIDLLFCSEPDCEAINPFSAFGFYAIESAKKRNKKVVQEVKCDDVCVLFGGPVTRWDKIHFFFNVEVPLWWLKNGIHIRTTYKRLLTGDPKKVYQSVVFKQTWLHIGGHKLLIKNIMDLSQSDF